MTDQLKGVIDEANAYPANTLSPYLFKTSKGESYLKEDNRCDGFQTIWQYWQNNYFPPDNQYSERSIRNTNANVDDLETASERLGQASTSTTKKFYRNKPTRVLPLPHKNIR